MKAEPLEKIKLLTIENGKARVGVDEATGWIRSLVWKRRKVDLFGQTRRPIEGYIGGIRVFDEVARKWYDDFDQKFQVRWINKGTRGKRLIFEKRFKGAPFAVRISLSLEKPYLQWDAELRQDARRKGNRQVKVVFFLPMIAGWKVWAPAVRTPFDFDGMSSFEYMYNQGPYVGEKEVVVPVLSHYSAPLDVGYTVCDYMERNIPASKFQFANGRTHFNWSQYFSVPNWEDYPYLEIVHSYIGMRGAKPCTTGVQVFFHEGDWRPGMGQVVKRYKEFFFPRVDAIWDRAGVYTCGSVNTAFELERSLPLGLKYLEVHSHFPWYGNYFPAESEWSTITELEGKRTGRFQPDAEFEKLNQEKIAERLKILKQAGVSPYWYMNYSDGFEDEVERRWPESIAKQEDGNYARSGWRYCHLMNPDPSLPFGRHILQNAKDALERYPDLDGFFLDCFRHFEFDFAHDDGVTLANNKSVYNISWGLGRLQEEVSKLLRKRNKDCFANKPRTIWTMRWVDGVLLEGQGDAAEAKWFWTCVAKPIFYLWGALEKPLEEYLKRCVILGGWPKLPSGNWLEDDREFEFQKRLYDAYNPLYEHFRRRVVCFEPDPIHFSDGLYGQLYTRPDGGYVAGVMTDWTSVFDEGGRKVVAPYVAFRLKKADELGTVQVHYAGRSEPQTVDYYRTEDGMLVVDMPEFKTAAVVILKPGSDSRNLGTKQLRDTHDYCGDPTSAFEFGHGAEE